ncbi:hypothetical protein BLOT_007108 [Blomia tropicalis]|nr:hypothetical protein BLOT_007108 [Blomia tropicalis]
MKWMLSISGASAGGRRCCELKQNSDEIFTSLLSLNDHYVYNDDGIERDNNNNNNTIRQNRQIII